ncbi:(2Fe-2S) ferredoxin domain-containing protein [Streptomyces sp. BH106]|uniref:(2Fe-2S) ferredoxin domain-containing protein n=1 Tax=Streptomyces sp. BH106 TaxID=3410409 RepID=UPI003CF727B9
MPATTLIGAARTRPCTLVVCRGCCCGDARKYPGYDHDWQLERWQAAARASQGRFAVRVVDCLGPCDQANVVVLQPSAQGRARGGKATWIGWSMGDDATDEVLAWAEAGGPGLAPAPIALELQFIEAQGERVRRRRSR